jgi:hypothetical protein
MTLEPGIRIEERQRAVAALPGAGADIQSCLSRRSQVAKLPAPSGIETRLMTFSQI